MNAIVNGVRLHFEMHGSENSPPLLFVHGFPLTGAMWAAVADKLAGDYRLIIPDLRGFGGSELQPPAHAHPGKTVPLSMAAFADDLYILLESIGEMRPAVLIGLSMGGYVAFEFHRRYTSRVRALALVDTRAPGDSPERVQERHRLAERVLEEGSHVVADAMLEKLFAPNAPAALKQQWRDIMRSIRPETIASALLAMGARGSYERDLQSIYCPTLIVVGEQDAITPLADAERMHRAILSSHLRVIPGAGHMTPVEQPEHFAAGLREFLAGM